MSLSNVPKPKLKVISAKENGKLNTSPTIGLLSSNCRAFFYFLTKGTAFAYNLFASTGGSLKCFCPETIEESSPFFFNNIIEKNKIDMGDCKDYNCPSDTMMYIHFLANG